MEMERTGNLFPGLEMSELDGELTKPRRGLFGTAQYHVTRSSGRGKRKYRVRRGWVGCLGGIFPGAPGDKHESLGLKKLDIDRATGSTPTGNSLTEVNKENGGAIAEFSDRSFPRRG
jgi:hypothetical protein